MSWLHGRLAFSASFLVFVSIVGFDVSQAFAERPSTSALKWIAPDADAVRALFVIPAECSAASGDRENARLVRLGRVAFRSPALLGGLAARLGMSCDSCHRNGHGNPIFFFPGVSGDPGTADVTGSVFSTTREDGVRNPVTIPSLVDSASTPPFGTIVAAADLRTFLHTAVVDEFQGASPPESVMTGLLAYLQSLQSIACPELLNETISFEKDSGELLGMFDVVVEALREGDLQGGKFVLNALRGALERVYRRFPAKVAARERLIETSRAFSDLREELDEPTTVPEILTSLSDERSRLESILRSLRADVENSFYDAGFLRRALE